MMDGMITTVGVPKEIKTQEYRVAMTPDGVREFERKGIDVFVETGAGEGASFSDDDYRAAGATIVPTASPNEATVTAQPSIKASGRPSRLPSRWPSTRPSIMDAGVDTEGRAVCEVIAELLRITSTSNSKFLLLSCLHYLNGFATFRKRLVEIRFTILWTDIQPLSSQQLSV